jgi:hypothetical protein
VAPSAVFVDKASSLRKASVMGWAVCSPRVG